MKKLITLFIQVRILMRMKGKDAAGKAYVAKALRGDVQSQVIVGCGFEDGIWGFPKDLAEAVKWYRKAAEQGNAEGQGRLGRCYIHGKGIVKNEEEGIRWLKKAAAQKFTPSMFCLGLYYKNTNPEQAINWFKKELDTYYSQTGKENKTTSEQLKELGVYYHPSKNSSSPYIF